MKNIFKKNSKVIALALTVVMSVSLMSVGVFADSDNGNKWTKLESKGDVPAGAENGFTMIVDGESHEFQAQGSKFVTGTLQELEDNKAVTIIIGENEFEATLVDKNHGNNMDSNNGTDHYCIDFGSTESETTENTEDEEIVEEEVVEEIAEEEVAEEIAEEEVVEEIVEEEVAEEIAEEEVVEEIVEEEVVEEIAEEEVAEEVAEEEVAEEIAEEEVAEEIAKEEVAEEIEEEKTPLAAAPATVSYSDSTPAAVIEEEFVEEAAPLAAMAVEDEIVEEEFDEEETPLAAAPAEIEEEIFEGDVPLADIPKTNDNISVWVILMVLSGAAALCTVAAKRKVNG